MIATGRARVPARFGGYIWAKFIIALGEVPGRCVEILNFELAQRISKAGGRRGTYAPVPGPRLSARALAASQGQAEAPRGVQHKTSEAKLAREEAKLMEKHFNADSARWMDRARGDRRLWEDQGAWRRWEEQRDAVERAWEKALRLSEAAGFPYKNREGEWVNVRGDESLFGLTIERYLREIGGRMH